MLYPLRIVTTSFKSEKRQITKSASFLDESIRGNEKLTLCEYTIRLNKKKRETSESREQHCDLKVRKVREVRKGEIRSNSSRVMREGRLQAVRGCQSQCAILGWERVADKRCKGEEVGKLTRRQKMR